MATVASRAAEPAVAGVARPYGPSWPDLAVAWLEALPGPTLLAYAALWAVTTTSALAQSWIAGQVPVGEITFAPLIWGSVVPVAFRFWRHMNRVAADAFDAFRPAISPDALDLERARYELTTMPGRPALAILIFSYPFTFAYYAADPVASGLTGYPPIALAMRATFEGLFTAQILVVCVHVFRQLRLVGRLYAVADRIDLFHQAPLHAFSRLTARSGIALIAVAVLGYVANPSPVGLTSASFALWGPWLIGFPLAGLAVFIVPLLGIHGRLVAAKADLQGRSEERLKALLTELNHDVDALDLSRADGLQKTLGSLLQQRDVLAKLSTWPWSTGTLRAFVTAILLPLALFVVQRLLAQLV